MTTFALAPRPPPRDKSPECSSSSSDATRPRPLRPGKGPRAGRTHRLIGSRTKNAPTDGGKDFPENVRAKEKESALSFAKTFPAAAQNFFAPRPPAGAPYRSRAFAPEEDVENSALLRAVRDAENDCISPKRRKAKNGGARRFGYAFDGNAPRTPPKKNAETEAKKKASKARAPLRVAKSAKGRTGGGGGGGGGGDVFGVTNPLAVSENEDSSPRVRTRERRERVAQWAPGGSAGVRAWGELVGKTASRPLSGSSRESVSRESVSRDSSTREARGEGTENSRPAFYVGQRTARAMDALRSTRRRAWSADASPYAASLTGTGTLPHISRGARRSSSSSSSSSSLEYRSFRGLSDSNASAIRKTAAWVTPPKTLRARLERVRNEARDWERKCLEAEVERDALRLETEKKDEAVSVLTRSLAEAEERLHAKSEKESHGCVSPVAEHLEAGFRRYRRYDGKGLENVGDAPKASASPKPNMIYSVERSPSSPKSATRSRDLSGVANAEGSSPVRSVGPVGTLIRSPPSCGVSAVVEDSPPSALFAFFPFWSPPRELDGVPAWEPAPAASPGPSPGTGSPPAPVPAADAPGVPAGFEMGGALSEDEDGTDVPGDGPNEPRTPEESLRRAGEVFERTEAADPVLPALASVGSIEHSHISPSGIATASPVACASCAAARSRHEASEASCNALREALRATRHERETLESEKESLASRLNSAETDLSDAVASLHFERLDVDGDGRITLDDLLRAELFASYAQPVVERIFEQWTHSRKSFATETTTSAADDAFRELNAQKNKTRAIDAESFRALKDWTERKSKSAESLRFWFRVVDVDGDGVLSRHDIKWLYDAVYKDESTCVSLEDLTCQIFDMAGAREEKITCAAVSGSRLADGIFGILCNHDDMLLRRSTAEFSNEHAVPM